MKNHFLEMSDNKSNQIERNSDSEDKVGISSWTIVLDRVFLIFMMFFYPVNGLIKK